jgi:V/A-type H+-transporting ATPase subunit A
MPGEEGYPAYLASRLAEFYERAGRVVTLGSEERIGSVTVVGAVSPPGGDFSEPVTQNTLRITKCFWALDAALAWRRHFPAINWLQSYSLYVDAVKDWWHEKVGKDWKALRDKAIELLQRESELREIVQLVGPDALPERERVLLECARLIREAFLQQSAFDPIDTYCDAARQYQMLKTILLAYDEMMAAIKAGVTASKVIELPVLEDIARMKEIPHEEFESKVKEIGSQLKVQINELTQTREM